MFLWSVRVNSSVTLPLFPLIYAYNFFSFCLLVVFMQIHICKCRSLPFLSPSFITFSWVVHRRFLLLAAPKQEFLLTCICTPHNSHKAPNSHMRRTHVLPLKLCFVFVSWPLLTLMLSVCYGFCLISGFALVAALLCIYSFIYSFMMD